MKRMLSLPPLVASLLVLSVLLEPVAVRAQTDPRLFGETGYRVDNDAFWEYFRLRGELSTFGYPVSEAFSFLGCSTQFFQRLVMQRCGNGGVATLNLLDEGLLPYTRFNGSVVPGPDADLKNATPRPDDPAYGSAILDFVRSNAPDSFEGEPVNFQQTFFNAISPSQAGTSDPNILGLLDLELWGAPTSRPARDPGNGDFIYQRFQRGIMHYDRGCQCTRGLLLADYLKAVITGQNLPGDLADQARSSPLLGTAINGTPPSGTDYTNAFHGVTVAGVTVTEAPPPTPEAPTPAPTAEVPTPAPTAEVPTPAPTPESVLGRSKEAAPGQVAATLGPTEPQLGNEKCNDPSAGQTKLDIDVNPKGARLYPEVFTVCLNAVNANDATASVRISVAETGEATTLQQSSFRTGWRWPPNGPAQPGTYSISATQSGSQASDVSTVQVVDPPQAPARLLVNPRRGAPGTTFDVYLAGFPKNQPATLRVYRCDSPPQQNSGSNCGAPMVYVTSMPPIAVDGSGRAKVQLRSKDSDPKTQYLLLSDDMIARVKQNNNFVTSNDPPAVGKAWFCTAPAPTCRTERD